MTAITRHRGRAALAAGTALTLGVLGVLASGAAANAASIDQSKQGSIIIHKFANPSNQKGQPDGNGQVDASAQPVAGVTFQYCSITDVNLFDGTNKGWDDLNKITAAEKLAAADSSVNAVAGHPLGQCTSMTPTDANGVSTSPKLPLGAYFVREIGAPSNVVDQAAPFIVTLPTPEKANDQANLNGNWIYDVNVYPKNTIAEGPKKNVVDQENSGAVLGAPVKYEVTQLIPALAAGKTYDKFIVSDDLDSRLTPDTTSQVTVKLDGTSLVAGTDFDAAWNGQKLTVTLTAAGLAKLVPAKNIVVGFQAKVNSLGDGDIKNTAYVNLNDYLLTPGQPNDPTDGSPSNEKSTRWGDLTVEKVNKADQNDGLKGAKFQVYMGTTDQDSECQNPADISTGYTQVNDPTTGNPYEVTSDDSGTVFIPGLWIGDTETTVAADGTVSTTTVAGHDFVQRCYVLKEIVAPNGFVLPSGNAALTAVMVKAGTNGTTPLAKIDNVQQGVPELPFTGSSVQIALTVGGIALIVIALGGVMLIRRRRAATANENA